MTPRDQYLNEVARWAGKPVPFADAGRFQEELGVLVDRYLDEGVDPAELAEVLRQEASSDLATRLKEIKST